MIRQRSGSISNSWVLERRSFHDRGSLRCAGFSLLEVIVAMALATVLLGSVWSLFQILTRRQAIEHRQAESNQLIRSLHQRFTRDLNNLPAIDRRVASPLPPAIDQDSTNGGSLFWPFSFFDGQTPEILSTSAAVLRGDQSTLTLAQFVEPIEWEHFHATTVESNQPASARRSPPLLKEVVYYLPRWPMSEDNRESDSLESHLDSESQSLDDNDFGDEEPARPTLVREETLPNGLSSSAIQSAVSGTTEEDEFADQQSTRPGMPNQEFLEQDLQENGATVQRETLEDISVAAFAYFDGMHWRKTWDTDLEQRLPVAIRFRWRQSALPTTESSDSSGDFGTTMPPEELKRAESEGDLELDEASAPMPTGDGAAESLESRWYEGEWIFLLQPLTVPAGLPAESKFGFELGSLQRHWKGMEVGSGTFGGHHG
jgi:prepilin-type N-terminal cleavage/methylation domain-containing protein